jgi:hypothetical protein
MLAFMGGYPASSAAVRVASPVAAGGGTVSQRGLERLDEVSAHGRGAVAVDTADAAEAP